jgi:membrane protein implicated in regulation of membrane protease activity
MPLALTGQEWTFLVVAVGPLILAVVVVYIFWRWARRDEAREKAERDDI